MVVIRRVAAFSGCRAWEHSRRLHSLLYPRLLAHRYEPKPVVDPAAYIQLTVVVRPALPRSSRPDSKGLAVDIWAGGLASAQSLHAP